MLHITGRRPDGYHVMQSAVAFADIGDALEIIPAKDFSFGVMGPFADHAPVGPDNLVVRAVRAMEDIVGRRFEADVTLTKNIPAAAGLGGGSADAAATLRGVNAAWGNPLDHDVLHGMALKLGADVPVCLDAQTQWVEGIGDKITTVPLQMALPAVLIWPGQGLSTPAMFNAYRVSGQDFTARIDAPAIINAAFLEQQANDFTMAAIAQLPVLKNILDDLAAQSGCILSRLSGSGAACFGLYATTADAKKAADVMSAAYPAAWVAPCVLQS